MTRHLLDEQRPLMLNEGESRIRVIVADDALAFREALVELLSLSPSIEVTGVAGSADEVARIASTSNPQVALIDVNMPGGGEAAARSLKAIHPQIKILALTAHEDRLTVIGMLRAGASGYLVKGVDPGSIPAMIEHAARGEAILSRTLVTEVIEELIEALARSEDLSKRLRDLEKTKAQMVQVLSHELKTPVAILQGSALSLARTDVDLRAEDQRALAESIHSASRRISRLVRNISVAATVDRRADLPTRPVRAGDLIDLALAEFSEERERIAVEADPDALAAMAWADPDMAVRPLAQVIENALAFSEPGDIVTITSRVSDTEVEIDVLDRGRGVPRSETKEIFEAFTQSDSSLVRLHSGVGMGLYLARSIMDAHKGRIWVDGREGGGSRFVLAFPRYQE